MAQRKEIVDYLSGYLKVAEFKDYCPNGLQVEGKQEIKRIVAGVTASQALIERAIEQKADAILVHHGYFWKGESETITGIKQKRIKALLAADINLLAYHLPLDAHTEVGNNAQLARVLDLKITGSESVNGVNNILWKGELAAPVLASDVKTRLDQALGRESMHLSSRSEQLIQTLAWCTGGAQGYIQNAADLGVDAFISGEVAEQTFHQAKELDIHYFAAGHHATERYGVQALARHLETKFGVVSEFLDLDNPV